MAPKKNSRSALYYYALECMENNSCRASHIREAIEAVYPAWKTMSVTERMPYETRYENWKKTLKEDDRPMITMTNKIAGSVHEESNMDESQLIGRKIENIFKKYNKQDELKSQPFYFIKFQSFCKCDRFKDVKLNYDYAPYYVLAEVALIEYTLENGIQNEYHAFIKPNKIPLGFRSACMDTTRDVLGEMPLDNFSEVKKSYEEISQEIFEFVKPINDENNNNPKVVFCLFKDIAETKFGLNFLHDRVEENNLSNKNLIDRVYDLENLVNKLGKSKKDDFDSNANDILTSYIFDYALKTRCEWHEEKGVINCCLGIVKKYAFLISDTLCQLFNVNLTKNHMPVKESVSVVIKNTDFGIRSSRFNTRTSESNSNSRLNERNSTRTSNHNDSAFDEDDQKFTSYNYPIKRSATESPVFASTDIRFNSISNAKSTITESSIQSNIPSIYKPTYSESRTNLADIPKSLTTEVDEDGWVTRPSQKNNRNSNQDTKSVISETSNTNDNNSSLSGATKTVSSFKYQGRGKLVRRN